VSKNIFSGINLDQLLAMDRNLKFKKFEPTLVEPKVQVLPKPSPKKLEKPLA
jgi:hypothetical protein